MDYIETDKINNKIAYLKQMAQKYNELNSKCNSKYQWREDAINEHINALDNILNDITDEWNECYEEDLKEFEESN